MNYKPILIVAGEPNSIFFEIFVKAMKIKTKNPIVLIASYSLLKLQMKKLKLKKKLKYSILKRLKNINLKTM